VNTNFICVDELKKSRYDGKNRLNETGGIMLSRTVFTLKVNEGKTLHYNQGSHFHGVLMELCNEEMANQLHGPGIKPYSQWVIRKEEYGYWTINALQKPIEEALVDPILANNKQIRIENAQQSISVLKTNTMQYSYDQLVENYLLTKTGRYVRIAFLTPTSFKSEGRYQIFPTAKWIFTGLIMKFDAFSDNLKIGSDVSPEDFAERLEIRSYRLRTAPYSIEGIRIPAFIGEIGIWIHGPQSFVNVTNMLLRFGEFSGVGIKTGLGMGAMQIIKEQTHGAKKD